ncbi:MAG: phytanoyl-CoA dioxygenase family protein [Pseudomonadota bacterium]
MRVEHLAATTEPAIVQEVLERDGCCVIDHMLAPETLENILNELQPHMNEAPYGEDDFDGRNTRRCGGLVARSETSRSVIMHPTILGTAERALSHATKFQLHCTQTIAVGPGSQAQLIHRDQWAFDQFAFPSGFDTTFSTMWALTDFTEENGATRVIPGSHKFADKQEYQISDTIPAEMSAGSVLLYTGSLYHGAGANCTNEERIGMIIHYSLGWLRQEENQYLSVPQDILATLPEDLLRLMGYDIACYSLGFIDGGQDPIAAIRPELVRS